MVEARGAFSKPQFSEQHSTASEKEAIAVISLVDMLRPVSVVLP